jgi:hypothetical protein
VRQSAWAIGTRIHLAAGADRTLFVSIPRSDGAVLVRLDRTGQPWPGWPIEIPASSSCGRPLPVDDGSVRIVCDGTDLPQPDNDLPDVRAFAFDGDARPMAGWPVVLRPGIGRITGDDLVVLSVQYITDLYDVGTISHEAWLTTIAADGTLRGGAHVPLVETCCGERWSIGPDGVAYGSRHDFGAASQLAPTRSEVVALGMDGMRPGFPIRLEGILGPSSFDGGGRSYATLSSGADRQARILALEPGGHVAWRSEQLGITAWDTCVGIEGTCEVPAAPLVGAGGETFVVGGDFSGTAVSGIDPSGQVMAGWPYRSSGRVQGIGICDPGDICEGHDIASPAIGAGDVVYLLHPAVDETASGGSVVALGPAGKVRPGWPVELRRPGAAFWSVAAAADGMAYVLALEPETRAAASATILGIAPDSTVVFTTTIVEP